MEGGDEQHFMPLLRSMYFPLGLYPLDTAGGTLQHAYTISITAPPTNAIIYPVHTLLCPCVASIVDLYLALNDGIGLYLIAIGVDGILVVKRAVQDSSLYIMQTQILQLDNFCGKIDWRFVDPHSRFFRSASPSIQLLTRGDGGVGEESIRHQLSESSRGEAAVDGLRLVVALSESFFWG